MATETHLAALRYKPDQGSDLNKIIRVLRTGPPSATKLADISTGNTVFLEAMTAGLAADEEPH
jgi:hypothetical protein